MTDTDYREGDEHSVPTFEQSAQDAPAEDAPAEDVPQLSSLYPLVETPEAQVTVEGVPQRSDDVDAWGLSRNEWVNYPTFTVAFGPPRVDETGVWYDCRECEVSKPSISGLLMHRNRTHISDEMKRLRTEKMSVAQKDAAQRRREAQREIAPYVAEDPEVQAILAQTFVKGSYEAEAKRKRWSKAKARGVTESEFAIKELNRAIALAADPSIVDDQDEAPKKPKPGKKVDEASQADDLFERVARATDILFPNRTDGGNILAVAELQKDMLALMQGVQP